MDVSLNKKLIVILFLVYVIFIVSLLISLLQTTKVTINIQSMPSDSKLFIDNIEVKSGNTKIEPGTYTFKATKDGYKDDEYSITIKEYVDVRLLPKPISQLAIEQYNDEKIQQKREEFGGIRANLIGQDLKDNNKITSILPVNKFEHLGVKGPFSIDFGYRTNQQLYLLISNSSPNGRQNALQYLRYNGYNTANYDIEFADYNSPAEGIINE
jgi:hypothetical protein